MTVTREFLKWRLSQENSEQISMNCEGMTLDGAIEPLAIHSSRMMAITTNLQNGHHRLCNYSDNYTKY